MRLQNCSTSWGKVVALTAVHCRSPCMNVYGLKNLAWNTGGSLGQQFSHWPSRWMVAINDTILQLQQKELWTTSNVTDDGIRVGFESSA